MRRAPAALARAERLLVLLGAVDATSGALTDIGRRMLAIPAPPRLARLLLEAEHRGVGETGALLAALASERDILLEARAFGSAPLRDRATGPSDLLLRVELYESAVRARFDPDTLRHYGLDPGALRAVERAHRQLSGGRRAVAAGGGGEGTLHSPPRRRRRGALQSCCAAFSPASPTAFVGAARPDRRAA